MAAPYVWMGHPAHFICASDCNFHMATYISATGIIVSTIGEYMVDGKLTSLSGGQEDIYETYVFTAKAASTGNCCPYVVADWSNLDGVWAPTAEKARRNHMIYLQKYSKPIKAGAKVRVR